MSHYCYAQLAHRPWMQFSYFAIHAWYMYFIKVSGSCICHSVEDIDRFMQIRFWAECLGPGAQLGEWGWDSGRALSPLHGASQQQSQSRTYSVVLTWFNWDTSMKKIHVKTRIFQNFPRIFTYDQFSSVTWPYQQAWVLAWTQ